jgi:hypothetical protein
MLPDREWLAAPVLLISLPTVLPIVFAPALKPSEAELLRFGVAIGLNSFAFGYGCEWARRRLSWRRGLQAAIAAVVVSAAVIGVLLLCR